MDPSGLRMVADLFREQGVVDKAQHHVLAEVIEKEKDKAAATATSDRVHVPKGDGLRRVAAAAVKARASFQQLSKGYQQWRLREQVDACRSKCSYSY